MRMELTAGNLWIELDNSSGCISCIKNREDQYGMNWVLPNTQWGKLDGFIVNRAEAFDDGICITATNPSRELVAEVLRSIDNGRFKESYRIRNVSGCDYFITQETFGIHFPFNCAQQRGMAGDTLYHTCCTAHVWCGDNICWIYGAKLCGAAPYLMVNMTEGSITDYSISRDVARVPIGADYRGDIVLNPGWQVILPGEEIRYTFEYWFAEESPQKALASQTGMIMASADLYTPSIGQTVSLKAEYHGASEFQVFLKGKPIKVTKDGDNFSWEYSADTLGEKVFDLYAGGKHTVIRLFVIETLETLVEKRAHFIAEHQQYHRLGSPLDGAYLIYDNTEKRPYYNSFGDHNAARERIVMAILIAHQLQKKHDDGLMRSLERNLEFVERELYDDETATVYNDVLHNNRNHRIYNYPWFSLYFVAWYKLTGNVKYLERAARIILRYYELDGNKQESNGIEVFELVTLLKQEKKEDLEEQVKAAFLSHADSILERNFDSSSAEITANHEIGNNKVNFLAQAFLLTGDLKYLQDFELHIQSALSCCSFQPDYHFNQLGVRHWDGYWFGKRKQYGDTFPHYWSCLGGLMYYWYEKATGKDCKKLYENILRNNLCIFRPDGSAANNYLSPYKVTLYSSVEGYVNRTMPQGSFYGKTYDEWANDQDWSLYFADKLLSC